MSILFSDIDFQKLTEGHDLSSFSCGDTDLDDFIKNDALQYQNDLMAVTYLGLWQGKVVCYFSLANGVSMHRMSVSSVNIA
jgi:hypothetical protein